jgi:hypothetical protein
MDEQTRDVHQGKSANPQNDQNNRKNQKHGGLLSEL